MAPRDFTADSGDDALEQAEALIAEAKYYAWKHAHGSAGGGDDAASLAVSCFAQWQVVGRRVYRPVVDMIPYAETIEVVHDAVVVG